MPTSLPQTDRTFSLSFGGLLMVALPIATLVIGAFVTNGSASPTNMALVLQDAGRAVACAETQDCERPVKMLTVDVASKQ